MGLSLSVEYRSLLAPQEVVTMAFREMSLQTLRFLIDIINHSFKLCLLLLCLFNRVISIISNTIRVRSALVDLLTKSVHLLDYLHHYKADNLLHSMLTGEFIEFHCFRHEVNGAE